MTGPVDLIVGAVLMDDIVYADGSRRDGVPGGAGLYALAGAALFSASSPLLVTGTGRDIDNTFGPWLRRNGLSEEGLRFAEDHAPRNRLQYFDDRNRSETPVYGMEHFAHIEPNADDVLRHLRRARGLYLFRNLDPVFWNGLHIETYSVPVMLWEIALDACIPEERAAIEERARRLSALSINLEEAERIYGTPSEQDLIGRLAAIGTHAVFLRAGARGSYVITRDAVRFIPSLPVLPADVTGGGNAFSGAAMAGLAAGASPLVAAAMGTIAAKFAISQVGPPDSGSAALRREAARHLQELLDELEQRV